MISETILLGILGIGLFAYLLIAGVTALQVYSMSKAGLQTDPTAPEAPAIPARWAAENEFGFLGTYRMKTPMTRALIYAWQRTDRPTYFCTYIIQSGQETKESYDLVTVFGDDIGLTTSSTKDGHMFPKPPHCFIQSFSPSVFDDRWARHIEMENYLMDVGGAQLVEREDVFEELIIDAMRKQMDYVRGISLWFLRAPIWFFIRRSQWHNLSIEEQYRKRLIKLPKEIGRSLIQNPKY